MYQGKQNRRWSGIYFITYLWIWELFTYTTKETQNYDSFVIILSLPCSKTFRAEEKISIAFLTSLSGSWLSHAYQSVAHVSLPIRIHSFPKWLIQSILTLLQSCTEQRINLNTWALYRRYWVVVYFPSDYKLVMFQLMIFVCVVGY